MSAPQNIVDTYLKSLQEASKSLTTRFFEATDIGNKLKTSEKRNSTLNFSQQTDLYAWYKIATGAKLGPQPSFLNVIAYSKWNALYKALNIDKLTADQCKEKYINLIIGILKTNRSDCENILNVKASKQAPVLLFSTKKKLSPNPSHTVDTSAFFDAVALKASADKPSVFGNPLTQKSASDPQTALAAQKMYTTGTGTPYSQSSSSASSQPTSPNTPNPNTPNK